MGEAERQRKGKGMTQLDLTFNSKPNPRDLFKPGSQNYYLYQRLLNGPVSNIEIVRDMCIMNSTGRISDLRQKLKPYLLDIQAQQIPDGNGKWLYSLRG